MCLSSSTKTILQCQSLPLGVLLRMHIDGRTALGVNPLTTPPPIHSTNKTRGFEERK